MRKLRSFFSRNFSQQILLLKATMLLPFCQLCVKILPFRIIVTIFHLESSFPSFSPAFTSDHFAFAKEVHWAIQSSISCFHCCKVHCLGQALAGRILLRQKRISSTLFLGVKRKVDLSLGAHAWLCCGDVIVTGRDNYECFTPIAIFY
jgi:hypothetical protein